MTSFEIRSRTIHSSVTALLPIKNTSLLLVGIGGYLELYDLESKKICDAKHLLGNCSASVHSIKEIATPESSKASIRKCIAFGGKEIREFAVSVESNKIQAEDGTKLSCNDWTFDVIANNGVFSALTAHNRVLTFNESKEEIGCDDDKSILYSGKLVENGGIVIAGTVFRQVIVWSTRGKRRGRTLHRLKGHDGVIFSVDYNRELNLIVSTSDDRSARLYKVSLDPDWDNSSIKPSHVLSTDQHQSRVFRSLILAENNMVATGNEDGTVSFWSLADGQCVNREKVHDGSPVWCLAQAPPPRGGQGKGVISGGGDASVKHVSLGHSKIEPTKCQLSLERDDYVRIVTVLRNQNVVLCLTNLGYLLVYDIANNETKIAIKVEDLFNYGLMTIVKDGLHVAIGTLDGTLKVVSQKVGYKSVASARLFNGKVFALEALDNGHVLACGPNGQVVLINLTLNQDENQTIVEEVSRQELPPAKSQRWFSTAKLSLDHDLLVIGDRNGNVHIYKASAGALLKSIWKAHGHKGIGAIEFFDQKSLENGDVFFQTAGRDGIIKSFKLEATNQEAGSDYNVSEVGSRRLKIKWLERFLSGQPRFILGFHSTDFVIYDLEQDRSLVEVECGGSHRSWDLVNNLFIYIKDQDLMVAKIGDIESLGQSVIRPGLHTREINCVAFFEVEGRPHLVTGSEDTRIKLLTFDDNNITPAIKTVQTLSSHISSVKCLKIVPVKGQLLMLSAGGRAQMKVWRISGEVFASELASFMLKGNDKKRKKTWRDNVLIEDAETRFMDVDGILKTDLNLEIAAACSDGVLRILNYCDRDKEISLIKCSDTRSHCILLSKCLPVLGNESPFAAIMTTQTNGVLAVWRSESADESDQIKPVKEVQIGQSGLNSINFLKTAAIFGGDDGILRKIDFPLTQGVPVTQLTKMAHSAQITGITGLDSVQNKKNNILVSCSVDQRITVWNPDTLDHLGKGFSHVPDIQDMVIWKDNNKPNANSGRYFVCVVGSGLEIMDCPHVNCDFDSVN